MSTIRVIYEEEPRFPATDQHPDATRYRVGRYWVDVIGPEPSLAEVEAVRTAGPAPPKDVVDQIIELSPARKAVLKAELAKP